MSTEVVRAEPAGALMRMDPSELIAKAIDKGADLETMERLVALAKDVRAEMARDAWYVAMAEFQRQCPTIRKTKQASISTRGGGSYRYSYAPLDEILATIQPVMGPLGLSVSWKSKVEPSKVLVSCRVSHTLGHSEESGDIAMPIVEGDGSGANPAQRVGIAATYAKRYSLLGIIGMAPEDDPDAKGQERPVPREGAAAPASPPVEGAIPENKVRMFHAVARGKWTDEQVHGLLTGYKCNTVAEIQSADFAEIIEKLKAGPDAK